MLDLLNRLEAHLADGHSAAWCRLVETRGSTPQKAGAAMVVFDSGGQAGTLGGGCVEAEVKRRALAILADGSRQIATFQLDSDYGWDDGLICGGRMQILIEPLSPQSPRDYFTHLATCLETGSGCVEAIVFDPPRQGLAGPGSFLFAADGRMLASLADDPSPVLLTTLTGQLPELATRPRASATAGIAWMPILPRCRLLIVGGGHIGQAVAQLAPGLDFDVWVVDDRPEYCSPERFPLAQRRIAGDVAQVLADVDVTPDTYCLIVTRGHNHDEEALFHLADRGARYVGMIGSRRKIKLIFDDLLAEGVSATALGRVFAPVGIEIGSQSVQEIAISILAELVSHRNLQGQIPGRPAFSELVS